MFFIHNFLLKLINITMTLSELEIGKSAKVIFMDNPIGIKNRLNMLGLITGIKITLIRKGILNGPIEIKVRDFYLAIRREDADKIKVSYE